MITWVLFFILFVFRARILTPIIGATRMFAFDAVMWTLWGAYILAMPVAGLEVVSYLCGFMYVVFAFIAARNYVMSDENARKTNGKRDAGAGPTAGK